MKVFLTGATGYLGSAVLNHLLAEGHSVVAHMRSPTAVGSLVGGVRSAVGSLSDRAFIAELLHDVDAVVHTASPNDETSAAVDSEFLDAVLPVLAGSSRAFVYTAGTWVHGSGSSITEDAAYAPPPIVAWRPALIDRVRAASADDVRTVVISPANLYGDGGGIPALLARGPITEGREPALPIVGGTQHFPNVHRDDIAQLYALAANTAPAGSYYLGANTEAPTMAEMMKVVHRRVVTEPIDASRKRLGLLTDAILLDATFDCTRAHRLGWTPTERSLLDELADKR